MEKPRVAADQTLNGGGEVIIYQAPDGQIRLDVRLEQDTVWLTQAKMARLFGKNVRTISEHIRNVFKEKELDDSSVIRNFRITARDGKTYDTQFYNLDVIISVGYRVKSRRGTQFRIWATQTLRDHLLRDYTVNPGIGLGSDRDNYLHHEAHLQMLEQSVGGQKRVHC